MREALGEALPFRMANRRFIDAPSFLLGGWIESHLEHPASGKVFGEAQEIGGTKIARILFVDYHRLFRQAASFLMNLEPDLEVVAQAASVAEARERIDKGGFDSALVDVPLPDEGAADVIRALFEAKPSVPVLVLTTVEDGEAHRRFLEAGAAEVLPKGIGLEDILAAVRRLRVEGEV